MDLEIVKGVQSLSNKFFDVVFSSLTHFGDEIFFVCMFLILYWVVNKVYAFKFAFFYVISYAVNVVFKSIIKRPRPWQASGEVINKLQASGYSFPSGHSQSISAISTFVVYDVYKNKNNSKSVKTWSLVVAILMCAIVGVSRLYLGQHYLTDVLVGLSIGFVVIFMLQYVSSKLSDNFKSKINCEYILPIASIAVLTVVALISLFNLELSAKTLWKIYRYGGMLVGYTFGYIFSNLTIKEELLSIWQKFVKVAVGLVVLFGLYIPLSLISANLIYKFFVIVVLSFVATYVYPLLFNLGLKKIKKD